MGLLQAYSYQGNTIDYTNTNLKLLNFWVIASRENNQIRVSDGLLESSINDGNSWDNSLVFADADKILSAYIHANGNISLFTIDNKIYKTDTSLSSVDEVILLDTDKSTPYVFHTPSNASFPGAYFECEDHMSYSENNNIHILANYCNSPAINGGRGASAVIVPTSIDYGETYFLSYKFGQHQVYKDDGTQSGDSSTGTLLGDASNTDVSRHVHSIEYNEYNNKYYMNTGDRFNATKTPDMDEVNWYEGTFNTSTNTIDWVKINFGVTLDRTDNLKATGMFFTPTHIYWGSDANPVTVPDNQGIFRSPIDTFSDISTHEKVLALNTEDVIICMKLDKNTNTVLAVLLDEDTGFINRLLAVKDFGFGESDIYTFENSKILLRLNDINTEGFFRLDLQGFDTLQSESLLIKIGDDLFSNL